MEENDLRDLESIFAQVEDPRMERTKLHRLRDIIILAICGVICGAEGWVEIEEFGKAKEAFFREWLDLANGIPSHDTFGRVFALIDPKQFEASFVRWVEADQQDSQGSGGDRWQDGSRAHMIGQQARKRSIWSAPGLLKIGWFWLNWQPKRNRMRSQQSLCCYSS